MDQANGSQNRKDSFTVAFSGLWHVLKTQKNFQIQSAIGIVVAIAAFVLNFSRIEWLILIFTIALVLAAELINTVIEVVVDLAVKEKLIPEAKLAKDVSAATVLLVSLFAVIVGIILFFPHLW